MTHFAENRITPLSLGHVWWVLKGQKATNGSTCALLFQRIRNVSVKSEALPSRFVVYDNNNNNITIIVITIIIIIIIIIINNRY